LGELPAIAAVTTIAAAVATTATTAAATSATATTSTVASVSATTSAATRAFRLRARFVDHKVPAAKVLTVEAGYRAIRFFIIGDLDESKAARLPRETVTNQADGRGADSQLSKPLL
jgi:hypothetical protein